MFQHIQLGKVAFTRSRKLSLLIAAGEIRLGGNSKLKIYGTLSCQSGKRMKPANRVFFSSEQEAIGSGYRPCGHCMKEAYQSWQKTRNDHTS
jgi:hypothetical protein